jgi:hypothetical protein
MSRVMFWVMQEGLVRFGASGARVGRAIAQGRASKRAVRARFTGTTCPPLHLHDRAANSMPARRVYSATTNKGARGVGVGEGHRPAGVLFPLCIELLPGFLLLSRTSKATFLWPC